MTAIEAEEKVLRQTEARNEIYELINEMEADEFKQEEGKIRLQNYTERFEKTFAPESDDEDGITDKDHVYTKLPWDQIERSEEKDACERYCKALAKKEDLLMMLEGQLEYHFDFDLEKYAFLAVVLSRICRNLDETRLNLVPDEVTEQEFWRNYFYQIELWKQEHGHTSRLGSRIDTQERE